MKKLVSFLLAACMCLSAGALLTSCGHEHTWNDGEITTPATAEADGVKTFTCTECGETKTESVTLKTTVTEAEWKAAFEMNNFNNVTLTRIFERTPVTSGNNGSKQTMKITPEKNYIKINELNNGVEQPGEEAYNAKADDILYHYEKSDGDTEWVKDENGVMADGSMLFSVGYVLDFSNYFNDFTYNESTKSYKAGEIIYTSNGSETKLNNVELKFAEGKMVYFARDTVNGSTTDTVQIEYYDYGTTTIVLPVLAE